MASEYSNIGGSGVSVAGSDITFSVKLKSLVVTLDQSLSFDQYVQKIVKASNYHIKALRHIQPVLSKSVANTVACIASLHQGSTTAIRYFTGPQQQTSRNFSVFRTTFLVW
jgi:hypothetical protein